MSKRTQLLRSMKREREYNRSFEAGGEKLDMCIEALEKQVAKKPKIIGVSDYAEYMKCPQCRLTTTLYSNVRPDYCSKCGQKLLWEVE